MAFATLTINISQINANINQIKTQTNAQLLFIAKANCYGLGAINICNAIQSNIDGIGVATIEEAIELRQHNITSPILLLSEPLQRDYTILHSHDITVTVYNKSTIQKLDAVATHEKPIKTHLKIDTGMSRLGTHWETATDTISTWLNTSSALIKHGIYTHFANSESKASPLNQQQLTRFKAATKQSQHLKTIQYHCANSAAIDTIKDSIFEITRIGLRAYDNAITLSAPIRMIKTIPANTSVGYGSKYTTQKETSIAIIGIGYADGIPSQLSNNGHVIINNTKCNIIGKICMDMFMVELPNQSEINDTHTAMIIDPSQACMTINDIAQKSNQNPREIMCHFSNRLKRNYLK